jgi:hypothetical protein
MESAAPEQPPAHSPDAPEHAPEPAAKQSRPLALVLLLVAIALAFAGQYIFHITPEPSYHIGAELPLQAVLAFALASGCLFVAARLVGLPMVPRDDD